jgi:hypothetical protein
MMRPDHGGNLLLSSHCRTGQAIRNSERLLMMAVPNVSSTLFPESSTAPSSGAGTFSASGMVPGVSQQQEETTSSLHLCCTPLSDHDGDNDNENDNNDRHHMLMIPTTEVALPRNPLRTSSSPLPSLQRRVTQGAETVLHTSLICGLLAGVAQAGVFNPYDRALYLSVTNNRPFLHRENWTHPYRGFIQSLGGRALAGGLYFPLEQFFLKVGR